MVTPQITEYIKTQMQSGLSVDQIKEALFQSGWQSSDIEYAFATITPVASQPISTQVEPTPGVPSKKKLYIGLIVFFVAIAALAVAAYIFGFPSKSQSPQVKAPKTNPSPTQFVATPTIEAEKKVETSPFVDSSGVFAFDYVKNWKIQSQETMAVISDPQNGDASKCDGAIENLECCDAVVSSIPYSGVGYVAEGVTVSAPPEPSHEDQVKQLAAQLGNVENNTFTNAQGLKGYLIKSPAPEGYNKNTYNFLFEGVKNMILVQIPVPVDKTVSEEHKVIIQSIREP